GDWVAAGDTIANSGNSGGQKVAALYFELRLKGKPLNPKSWLR
ncbi:MAG: peptidoglycan DD-metalloendopeptidase family protein, partial [Dokdonella sp.]